MASLPNIGHAPNTTNVGVRIRAWIESHRLLVLALVGTLAFHGVILFSGSYRGTYDAFVHIFFADHYARGWWTLWEPRWYTGFPIISYPPLSHQLTALLSKVSSLPMGFTLVMLVSSVNATLGVYRFCLMWVDERPASYAALMTVFSSSIAETVHVFGQLPTMFVIGTILNSLPFLWRWLEEGKRGDLFRAWALLMVACAGHHVTTVFGMVFFSGPIFATVLLRKFRRPRADEPDLPDRIMPILLPRLIRRRLRRILPTFIRCVIFGVVFIMIAVFTVLPYWLWSSSDPITQITIPHGSRDSFLENRPVGFMFFVVPWGVLITTLPYAIYKGIGSRNWILLASLLLLSLLGTGGTTPIPAMLLGGAFYILTLDRFTFWASIVILPFAGEFVVSLLHGRVGAWIEAHLGVLWRVLIPVGMGLSLVGFALFVANLTQFRRFQPAPLDMTPIVEFLSKDKHDSWRFMTLGFGDQLAWLSAQTTALNVEGNYHSARRLPEMTSTPIERLDGAKFQQIPGLGSLHQFIANPHKYNLKYIFVNDAFYEPLLHFSGWVNIGTLENDVGVWERADVPPLPAAIPSQDYPDWQRLMWGTVPVGSLVIAATVFTLTGIIPDTYHKRRMLRKSFMSWFVDDFHPDSQPPGVDWQVWRRWLKPIPINLTPVDRRTLYGVLLLVGLVVAVASVASVLYEETQTAEAVMLAYYDDLDFGRFLASYDHLQSNLGAEEYLRWLSLRGGLVASFSKLENLYIDVEHHGDGRATAHVTADWLTSLGTYPREETYEMVRDGTSWKIVFEEEPPPPPRETFVISDEPIFFINTPLADLEDGALNRGVLDRSLLSVSPVQVVYVPDVAISFTPEPYDIDRIEGRFEGLISVMGEITNLDPYPTHITVTVILRDKEGNRIAETNTMDAMRHQLLPGETTPFRVDFSGADARDILNVAAVKGAEIVVRGVPTSYNLERPLVQVGANTLYNSSAKQVDIPALLVRYPNWIERVYLEQAIAPDETGMFIIPPPPEDIQRLPVAVSVDGPRLEPWSEPPDYGLLVDGYIR